MKKIIFILILNSIILPGNSSALNDSGNDTTHIDEIQNWETVYALNATVRKINNPPVSDQTTIITSPCLAGSVSNGQAVTNFFNIDGYQNGFNDLIKANVPGIGTEFATTFGISYASGLATSLPIITTLPGTSITVNGNPASMFVTAIGHTHPDNVFPAPSAGDLYAFGNYAQSHPNFLYFILAANGSKYVLMVTDPANLAMFLKLYPQKINIEADSSGNAGGGAGYNPGSDLYLAMQQFANRILSKSVDPSNPALTELDAAHEAVQVYILDHFNTGMTLFKQDVNGHFHELHIDNNSTTNQPVACN